MNSVNRKEDDAFDALLISAFLQDMSEQVPDLGKPDPKLDPADAAALDALGLDLVRRVIAGERQRPPRLQRPHELELTGAMNRGGEDGQLTPEAQEEIERRIRELEDQEDEGGKEQPDDES